MHPVDIGDLDKGKIIEDPDFDQEKVWKKIFKKVECEFCSDDGHCNYVDSFALASYPIKCPKWNNFDDICPAGGICQGTISIIIPNGQITWNSIVGVYYGT